MHVKLLKKKHTWDFEYSYILVKILNICMKEYLPKQSDKTFSILWFVWYNKAANIEQNMNNSDLNDYYTTEM